MNVNTTLHLVAKQSKLVGLENDIDVHAAVAAKLDTYHQHLATDLCAADMNNIYDNDGQAQFNEDMSTTQACSSGCVSKYIQNMIIFK